MVQSRLHKKIQYNEYPSLDEEDYEQDVAVYTITLLEEPIRIVLGKKRDEFSHYHMYYFPVYLLNSRSMIRAKIGIFEIEGKNIMNVFDEDEDIDLDLLEEPLLFSFVTKEFLKKYGSLSNENPIEEKREDMKTEKEIEQEEELDSILVLPQDGFVATTKKLVVDDIFMKDTNFQTTQTYVSETVEDAKQWMREYQTKQSPNDNWIQKQFKNKEYEIHHNDGSGDCFFYAIRDAFGQIGFHTTIANLRKILSQEATDDMVEQYKLLYRNYQTEIQVRKEEKEGMASQLNALKKKTSKPVSKEIENEILQEAKQLQLSIGNIQTKIDFTEELLNELIFIKSVETLEQFQSIIESNHFWADTWTISTMERLLNIKIIILEKSEDVNAVLQCGQMNDVDSFYDNYDPKYYIIVAKTKDHYELVSYRTKKILSFSDIPYALKIKVVEKCMERNAGLFNNIPAFKQFQMDVGRKPIVPTISEETNDLYDKNIVFMFHIKSDKMPRPGKGTGEQIVSNLYKDDKTKIKEREKDFANLKKTENWRNKLSDDWETPFEVDGKRWASISHYLIAFPLKENHRDIYDQFSLDSKSDISKSLKLAKASIEKKTKNEIGKYYDIYSKLKIPSDLRSEYRKRALKSKFTQNADLTTLLVETKQAKLTIYKHKEEPEIDIALMELRKTFEKISL